MKDDRDAPKDNRNAFEKCMRNIGCNTDRVDSQEYRERNTADHWIGWKAAQKTMRENRAEAIDLTIYTLKSRIEDAIKILNGETRL